MGLAHPQAPAPAVAGSPTSPGFVIGSVYDGETQLPVRFAAVNLVPVPAMLDAVPAANASVSPGVPSPGKQIVRKISGVTDINGSFHMKVPEGDYLAAAVKPSYLNPSVEAATNPALSEDQLRSSLASLPQVHVRAGQTASVSLQLRRGAVVSGRMKYVDGSPAIHTTLSLEALDHVLRRELAMRPENQGRTASSTLEALQYLSASAFYSTGTLDTNDEGRFRIDGLAPGKYIVSTTIQIKHPSEQILAGGGMDAQTFGPEWDLPELIPVYAPAALRRRDARVLTVHGGEQISDVDLTIDFNGLHSVQGRVLPASTHKARGMVVLREVGNDEASRASPIEEDGTFLVHYLPSGTYEVQIVSFDNPGKPNAPFAANATVELTTVVADQDVLLKDVLVCPLQPSDKNP